MQVVVGPKALMHPDVEEALPGTTYNALTRRAGPSCPPLAARLLPPLCPAQPPQVTISHASPHLSIALQSTAAHAAFACVHT